MAAGNKVTLTFAGDASLLDRTYNQVQAGGRALEESSKDVAGGLTEVSRTAKGTKEVIRGLGDATVLLGGQLGSTANQALAMTQATFALSKGSAELAKSLGLVKLATGGVILAIATAGAALAAHIDHTSILNEANRTAADSAYYLSDGLNFLGQKIPGVGGALGWLKGKTDAWSQSAHGMTNAADEAAAALQNMIKFENQSRVNGTFGIADQNPGGDAFVDQNALDNMELDPKKLAAQYNAASIRSSAGSSAKAATAAASATKAALDAARQAAEKSLSDWQSTLDKYRNIAKGVADAFAPKLEAADKGLVLFPGKSALDKLKEQLQQTLKLKQDIAKLTKAGLDSSLLTQIVNGGLDSLPLADQLLASGKGGIRSINSTAAQISTPAGSIAGSEAQREYNQAKTQTLKVDVSGGDGDLKKLIRKWLKTDDGFRNDVKLALK